MSWSSGRRRTFSGGPSSSTATPTAATSTGSPTAVGLEWISVHVSQAVGGLLFAALLARVPHRHVLQLALGTYLAYSVALYFLSAHLSGYADMRYQSPWTFFLFYGANLPWLLGYGFMALDAARALVRGSRAHEHATQR